MPADRVEASRIETWGVYRAGYGAETTDLEKMGASGRGRRWGGRNGRA